MSINVTGEKFFTGGWGTSGTSVVHVAQQHGSQQQHAAFLVTNEQADKPMNITIA